MDAHYYLPAGVVALKFLMKIAVEQEVSKVEFAKALLAFPIDLTFLSLSFGVAMIVIWQTRQPNAITAELALLLFVVYIIAALVVTVLAKKSDRAFARDADILAIVYAFPGYLISFFAIILTLSALGAL